MRPNPLCCLTVVLAGCGGLSMTNPTGSNGAGGPTASVAIQDNGYAPSVITIQVGTRVIWTNNGTSIHSVTSDSTGFDSGSLAPPKANPSGGMTNGDLFQVTFATPGTYTYHCIYHAAMHGTITVQ